MGFSLTKIIKVITKNLVFEQAPKIACMLYSCITKKKGGKEKIEKKMQELVFLSSLCFRVELTSWWYMSMYKLCCFSVPIGEKKKISSQQIRHGALQKPSLCALSLLLECSPRCVCSSGCIRSACSHPGCKLYEMVINAQPLEDASLVSRLWVTS